ncbi:hypothetical protein NQ314_018280 [Rhamnusium bicolor]|uniref:HTH CENPB-type domain-containing protein n=1 Tax=Rhamnusium bicolor TaxID=1586634 RepID=A0AAV8WTI3_9CUCU|nr:hypothetical protein NQ314_018280 [Rhamnusium bicolor]
MFPTKCQHKNVTSHLKCKILESIEKTHDVRQVAEIFGVRKSTVYDIKKNKEKIQSFVSRTFHGVGKRKVMRKAEHPEMEDALYTWFLKQRGNYVPISSEILRTKAKLFYKEITGKDDFPASSGWMDKSKSQYRIHHLKVCGEKISNDVDAVKPFQEKFLNVVHEMQLNPEQTDPENLSWKKNIRKSWFQLWPLVPEDEDVEECISLAELKTKLRSHLDADLNKIKESLLIIDPANNLTSDQIKEWVLGQNENVDCNLMEAQIVEETLNRNHEDDEDEPECVEEENIPRIEHAAAIKDFKVCEQWAEENDVDLKDILLLRRLKETAENFIIRNKKKQTKIETYCKEA